MGHGISLRMDVWGSSMHSICYKNQTLKKNLALKDCSLAALEELGTATR